MRIVISDKVELVSYLEEGISACLAGFVSDTNVKMRARVSMGRPIRHTQTAGMNSKTASVSGSRGIPAPRQGNRGEDLSKPMEKESTALFKSKRSFEELLLANREAVNEYNEKTLEALLLMEWLLVLLPLIAVPFSRTKAAAVPAYLLTFSLSFIMFLLFKRSSMKKYTIIGLYASFSVFFLLGLYLSVIHSPDMRATILLGGFIIMPLSFIDRFRRSVLFLGFWLLTHTVLAFFLKPQYALDDTLNCLCAMTLGCYLGKTLVQVRLESFEARRLLVIEKETDVLTGLYNRRKLFETLAALDTPEAEKPSGIMMIDIDHFKDFNDKYGHAAGDMCLRQLGEALKDYAQHFRLYFYRYGGEEFVAMAYGYGEEELLSIAESLRIAVKDIDMGGHRITVSIGVACCDGELVRNYEHVIDRADKASYRAKRAGRNTVCMEQNSAAATNGTDPLPEVSIPIVLT